MAFRSSAGDNPSMAKNKSAGCLVAAAILVVLALLAIIPVLYLTKARSQAAYEAESMRRAHEAEMVTEMSPYSGPTRAAVLDKADSGTLAMPKPGEPVTREHLVAFTASADATDLSRETFQRVAEGAKVTWLLQVANVAERDGVLTGRFSLPWQVRNAHSSTSSTLTVDAQFVEDAREALLGVRVGDWVEVSGELHFTGTAPLLKNATVRPAP